MLKSNKILNVLYLFIAIHLFSKTSYAKVDYETLQTSSNSAMVWFLDPNNSMDAWSLPEKLGAAEFLYLTMNDQPDEFDKKRRGQIENILSSIDNLILKNNNKKPKINNFSFIRMTMLRLLVNFYNDEMFEVHSKKICDLDPENGLAWMFRAESQFVKGDFDGSIESCKKALDCSVFSFRDNNSLKNMSLALNKAELLDNNLRYILMLMVDRNRNRVHIIRHVTLLSNLALLQKYFDFYNGSDFTKYIFPERQYISYLLGHHPFPMGIPLVELQKGLQTHERKQMKYKEPDEWRQLMEKEQKFLETTRNYILLQIGNIKTFAETASGNEMQAYLDDPEKWWQKKQTRDSP